MSELALYQTEVIWSIATALAMQKEVYPSFKIALVGRLRSLRLGLSIGIRQVGGMGKRDSL